MQTIELEVTVDQKGNLHLPEKYHDIYGKPIRLRILLPEKTAELSQEKNINLMKYSNTVDWPVDGLDYQAQVRDEWAR